MQIDAVSIYYDNIYLQHQFACNGGNLS